MIEFKIFYACNGYEENLINACKYSVLSARRFLDREDIIVSFHPPYDAEMIDKIIEIDEFAIIELNQHHIGKPFNIHPLSDEWKDNDRYYGEKINIRDVDSENVLLLDCDTLIINELSPLFEGDFDFGGRAMDLIENQWQNNSNLIIPTKRVLRLIKNKNVHMWAGAYCVFKNNFHKLIGDEWLDYYNNKRDILDYTCKPNRKTYDQSALIPAVHHNTNKIKLLNDTGYILNLNAKYNKNDLDDDVIILHGNNLVDELDLREELDMLSKKLKNL